MIACVRRDVVDALVAKARHMSRNGCGRARSLAEGQVQWHLSTGAITAVEAAAVLQEIPANADYYGSPVLQIATPSPRKENK